MRNQLVNRLVAGQHIPLDAWTLHILYDIAKRSFVTQSIVAYPAVDEELLLRIVRTEPRHAQMLNRIRSIRAGPQEAPHFRVQKVAMRAMLARQRHQQAPKTGVPRRH